MRSVAVGPAGSLCALVAYMVCFLAETTRVPDEDAQQFAREFPQTKPLYDLVETRRREIRTSSMAFSLLIGGAVILSAAGMIRGNSAYQHAHHLTGLLFGSAYGHAGALAFKYTSDARFDKADTAAAV